MSNSKVKGGVINDLVAEGRDSINEGDNLVDQRDLGLRDYGGHKKDGLKQC